MAWICAGLLFVCFVLAPRDSFGQELKLNEIGGRPAGAKSEFAPSRTTPSNSLGEQERGYSCHTLHSVLTDLVDQIKRLQSKATFEQQSGLPTLARTVQRWSGPTGRGSTAMEELAPSRAYADALARLYSEKSCGRFDLAALLRPAEAPAVAAQDRCRVRTDFALEDCVEDIAQWRCRTFAGKGRAYLECITTVAQRVIAASGFRVSALVHYAPDCNDKGYAAWTCSVFSNNRNGGGTKWCARVDASAIDECDMPIPKPAPGAAHVSVRPPVITGQKIPDKPGGKTNCHRISCGLGACERVCSPPS